MDKDKLLEGKRILIVDDEPDVLDTLEDLLAMCITTKAATYNQAKTSSRSRKALFSAYMMG